MGSNKVHRLYLILLQNLIAHIFTIHQSNTSLVTHHRVLCYIVNMYLIHFSSAHTCFYKCNLYPQKFYKQHQNKNYESLKF